jgi:hypothetical protein
MEITPELEHEILDAIGDTASVFTTVVAKLYVNDGKSTDWTDTGLAGVLCFMYDRVLSAYLLRMYEPNTKDLLFEFELYYDFNKTYDSYGKFFHLFPIPGGVLGIYIPNLDTSEEFKEVITYFAPKEKTEIHKEEKKKDKNKIVNPIGTLMMGLRNKKQEKVQHFTMGKPYAVKLVSSIGWNSEEKSFNLDKVSKELKTVLKGMGIGKSDFRNKDTAVKLMKAFSHVTGMFKPQNIQEDSSENSSPQQTQNPQIYEDSDQSEHFYRLEEIPQDSQDYQEVQDVQEVQEAQDLEEEKIRMRSSTSRSMSQYNSQQYLLDFISNPPPEPKKASQPANPSFQTHQIQPRPMRNSVVKLNLQDHLFKEMQKRRAEISKYDLKSERSESDFNSEYSEGI